MNRNIHAFWADVFAPDRSVKITVLTASAVLIDGMVRDFTATECQALVLEAPAVQLTGRGTVQAGRVFLLPGTAPAIRPGDRIIHDGKTYELAKVQICRSLGGAVIARRGTAV